MMFPKRLREMREKRGLTQRELAGLCGLGDKQIWRYENEQSEPNAEALIQLARKLEVSTDYLLGLVDQPNERLSEEELTPMERKLIMTARQGQIVEAFETLTSISKGNDKPVIGSSQPAVDGQAFQGIKGAIPIDK